MKLKSFSTSLIAAGVLALIAAACTGGPGPEPRDPINPDIVPVCCKGYGIPSNHYLASWRDNRILAVGLFVELELGSNFEVRNVEPLYRSMSELRGAHYLELNQTGKKALVVNSNYGAVSAGALYELDLSTLELRLLRDSTYSISSAVYVPGSDGSTLIYYSYGQPLGEGAGYYRLDRETGTDSLLLEHISPVGPDEMLNGFDLSPDGSTLLIPDVRATPSRARPPQIVEYNLETQTADTLEVDFEVGRVRIGLWLRYSPDGTQILYSNFPEGVYTHRVPGPSEVGVIDLSSGAKRVLDVNTNPYGTSVQLAPTWSPSGHHIIYGSAAGPVDEPPGAKGDFSLYVLKNVN